MTGCQQIQPKNPTCTAATRQESSKVIGCLKDETRQQETCFPKSYLQPFRCSATQLRGSRRELVASHIKGADIHLRAR